MECEVLFVEAILKEVTPHDSATYCWFYVEFLPLFISLIKELRSYKLSNL